MKVEKLIIALNDTSLRSRLWNWGWELNPPLGGDVTRIVGKK